MYNLWRIVKLWFSRDKDISIRDQLTPQLMLGIVTGELPPGARLPSTRALARRFKLHPNTVSAVYRQLEQQRWVESVRGSGVYVRGAGKDKKEAQLETLDQPRARFRAVGAAPGSVRGGSEATDRDSARTQLPHVARRPARRGAVRRLHLLHDPHQRAVLSELAGRELCDFL
jgi:DNA-binding transcriptional regulator YhcF (GntR family)